MFDIQAYFFIKKLNYHKILELFFQRFEKNLVLNSCNFHTLLTPPSSQISPVVASHTASVTILMSTIERMLMLHNYSIYKLLIPIISCCNKTEQPLYQNRTQEANK